MVRIDVNDDFFFLHKNLTNLSLSSLKKRRRMKYEENKVFH
jgi:hypothetical protein